MCAKKPNSILCINALIEGKKDFLLVKERWNRIFLWRISFHHFAGINRVMESSFQFDLVQPNKRMTISFPLFFLVKFHSLINSCNQTSFKFLLVHISLFSKLSYYFLSNICKTILNDSHIKSMAYILVKFIVRRDSVNLS